MRLRLVTGGVFGLFCILVSAALIGCPGLTDTTAPQPVTTPFGSFTSRTILVGSTVGPGASLEQPAFIRFGPDGRLYVTTYTGNILALTLTATHDVASVETYKPLGNRLLTGIAFDPDAPASSPVIYVANNDMPIYGAPDFSGRISRIDDLAAGKVTDLIVGLPRSAENHMTFDLAFGLDGRLYICQGGSTNNGAPSPGLFANRSEQTLSAALLVADVRNPAFRGIQDVQVYAPGLRNTYAISMHTNGRVYGIDQGSNKGYGGRPSADGSVIEVPEAYPDELNVLLSNRYYGHPNPARGELAFRTNLPNGTPHQSALASLPTGVIVTGIAEYTSSANSGALQGKLLMTAFIGKTLWYAGLTPDGLGVSQIGAFGGEFANPLDLTVGPDGTIYVLEAGDTLQFGGVGPAKITVLEPQTPAAASGGAPRMFAMSNKCTDCHQAMRDASNADVSIDLHWRSSMMANAARDPFFQAKVSSEVARTPSAAAAIEAKCATCHTAMARTQAIADDEPVALLGAGFFNSAHPSHQFAMDGVSCTVCHQIRDIGLGEEPGFSGGYNIDDRTAAPNRLIFGPYEDPVGGLMQAASGFVPVAGEHLRRSALCSTCHTLFTQTLEPDGTPGGMFPEQATYLEWEHSDFANGSPTTRSCQDCHMPQAAGGVVISTLPGNTPARSPFSQHHFVGGNTLIPSIFKAHRDALGVVASDAELDATIRRATEQLQQRTAALSIVDAGVSGGKLNTTLQVTSSTGHKFPSGYPSRRAWIHFTVADASGTVFFDSGAPLPDGNIAGDDGLADPLIYEPHYDLITSPAQVQIYESVMGDSAGALTRTLMRAAGYIKDNRVLPPGFDKTTAPNAVAVHGGAATDGNFIGGSDRVRYEVNIAGRTAPYTVSARLLYQSIAPVFVDDLASTPTPEVTRFASMYAGADRTPVQISAVQAGPLR